jgi:hypothetical protein
MKYLIAAASVAVMGFAAPALAQAQPAVPTGVYGTLGYTNFGGDDIDLGAIQGRLGYRFNNYLGAEGELATGVKKDHGVKLDHQEAIYGVGFLPLTPQWELLGRVGYGHTDTNLGAADSWNYGGGVQYHWDGKNGVRAEYTRQDYQREAGGESNTWSVAYSRRF